MGRNISKVAMTGWRIDEGTSGSGNITIKDAEGHTVARVPFDNPKNNAPNDLDRARLIAAAPDLLATLSEYLQETQGVGHDIKWARMRDRAQAAITKATKGA